jgi:hypothetical protein
VTRPINPSESTIEDFIERNVNLGKGHLITRSTIVFEVLYEDGAMGYQILGHSKYTQDEMVDLLGMSYMHLREALDDEF